MTTLSPREHRNRPLTQLGRMADVVSRTILARAGVGEIQVRERPAWVAG